MRLNEIARIVKGGKKFFLASHKDPDGDAIGSLLALGGTLLLAGKEVVLFNEGPIPDHLGSLAGIERVVDTVDMKLEFDAGLVLDCGNLERVGSASCHLSKIGPLINIDHHENNSRFGDVNLVDVQSSSVGEIIYRLIKLANLPLDLTVAENLFVALQTDTGSFKYDNTTSEAFSIAGELVSRGVNPWRISRKVMDEWTLEKLQILESALKTIELHSAGKVGLITMARDTLSKADTDNLNCERFVDYARCISGVEIAVLIREIKKDCYRFSLRSNDWVNVAELASLFGGGGHPRAAAFSKEGSLDSVKQEFLSKAKGFLNSR